MAEQNFDDICERMEIPENLRKHVAASTPARAKMAVARGLLPVPPRTLLSMQYMLLGDSTTEVAAEAEKSLLGLPEDRLVPLIDRGTHPKLLEFLAYKRPSNQRLAETIALAHQINDKTLCYLAEQGSSRICEIVAGNQERLIITPQILLFLQRNENAGKALVDRVRSFQRLYGIHQPELEEAEARAEETPVAEPAPAAEEPAQPAPAVEEPAEPETEATELVGEAAPGPVWTSPEPSTDIAGAPLPDSISMPDDFVAGEVYIPPAPAEAYTAPSGLLNPISALLGHWGIEVDPNYLAPPEGSGPSDVAGRPILPSRSTPSPTLTGPVELAAGAEELTGHREEAMARNVDLSGGRSLAGSDFTFNFDEDSVDFETDLVDPSVEDDDQIRQSLQKKVSKMSISEKIKLAYKGNKSVRELLVRDPNKIIGVAVVKSGRITETEVMTIASNRSISEEVIRALTENREYLRKYPIKLALASNPKTPIPTAIGLLNSLHVNDLKKLSSNRNVSSAVFSQATKLYKARKAGLK